MKRGKCQSMPYSNPIIDFKSLDPKQPMAIMGPFSKDNMHEWFSTYIGPIPLTYSGLYFFIIRISTLWVLSPSLPTLSFFLTLPFKAFGHVFHFYILTSMGISTILMSYHPWGQSTSILKPIPNPIVHIFYHES